MIEEVRLLDHHNKDDVLAFHRVLDQHIDHEKQNKMLIRSLERKQEIINFHKSKFIPEHADDIAVGAKLIDGVIVDVFVGYKLHLHGWPKNFMSTWQQSIWYSTHHEWKSPEKKQTEVGILVANKMEEQGYYSWYHSIKFPNYKTQEECVNYVSRVVKKTLHESERYSTYIEYIHWKDQDEENIPFVFYKGMLKGVTQNRNMCVLSHHLKLEHRKFL